MPIYNVVLFIQEMRTYYLEAENEDKAKELALENNAFLANTEMYSTEIESVEEVK